MIQNIDEEYFLSPRRIHEWRMMVGRDDSTFVKLYCPNCKISLYELNEGTYIPECVDDDDNPTYLDAESL
jgi:hypothetical protein